MMHKTMLGVAGLVAAAMLGGCGGGQTTTTTTTDEPARQAPSAAEPVEILNQVHGDNDALTTPGVRLVKTQQQFADLGIENIEGLDVDFATQDLVILSLGETPTGGYWADITGVQLVGGVLYVQGVAGAPAEDAATTQQITHPFAAAVVAETPAIRALSDIESVVGSRRQ